VSLPELGRAHRTASPEAVFASLDLAVRRRLPGRLQGEHRGLRLGPGTEPEEVTRYRPGEDDVRRIDWNVTARSGAAHVWRSTAEHELETWVLVDDTASMAFGTAELEKRDVAAGAVAAMGMLTAGPGNRMGTATLGAGRSARAGGPGGLRWSAPLAPRAAALRALRDTERPDDGPAGVDLAAALSAFAARRRRTGLRVVVTDFVEADGSPARPFAWERPLRRLAAAHQTLVVEVVDPRELALPDVGAITLVDPESGRRREVWTGDRELRQRYAVAAAAHRAEVAAAVRASRAGHVVLRTDRDWVRDLARHVQGQRADRRTPLPAGSAAGGAR